MGSSRSPNRNEKPRPVSSRLNHSSQPDKRFDSPAKRLSVYEHTKRSFAHPAVESKRKECGNAMSFLNKMKNNKDPLVRPQVQNNKDPRRKSPVTSTRRLERRRGVDEVDVFDSRVIEKKSASPILR